MFVKVLNVYALILKYVAGFIVDQYKYRLELRSLKLIFTCNNIIL